MPDLGRTSPASRDPEPPISAAHNRGAVESREASRSALIEPNISGRILSRRRPSRIYTYAPGDMMRRVATVLIGQAGPRVRLEDEAAYRCCCEGGMLGAWDDVGAASSWSWLCRPGPVGPTTPWRRAPVSTPPSMSWPERRGHAGRRLRPADRSRRLSAQPPRTSPFRNVLQRSGTVPRRSSWRRRSRERHTCASTQWAAGRYPCSSTPEAQSAAW